MQPTTVRRINVGWIRSDSDNPPQTKVHKLIHTSIYWKHCSLFEHIPVLWFPAFPAGMTVWVFLVPARCVGMPWTTR